MLRAFAYSIEDKVEEKEQHMNMDFEIPGDRDDEPEL